MLLHFRKSHFSLVERFKTFRFFGELQSEPSLAHFSMFKVCMCAKRLRVICQNNAWVLKPVSHLLRKKKKKRRKKAQTVSLQSLLCCRWADIVDGFLSHFFVCWRLAAQFPWNWEMCGSGHEGGMVGWRIKMAVVRDWTEPLKYNRESQRLQIGPNGKRNLLDRW